MTSEYPPASRQILANWIGGSLKDKAEAYRKASPVTYVNRGDAPALLFQGTKDQLVPYQQAIVMIEAMTRAGVSGRAELFAGFDHGWGGVDLVRTGMETFAFFDRYLKRNVQSTNAQGPSTQ
jgi:dipeptidyl aminopeptidase/acylaminoacyl peptidase